MQIEMCLKLSIPLPMIPNDKVVIGVLDSSRFRKRRRACQNGCPEFVFLILGFPTLSILIPIYYIVKEATTGPTYLFVTNKKNETDIISTLMDKF